MAVRVPWAKVAGAVAIRLRDSAEPPRGVSLDAALEVIGQQGDQQTDDDRQRRQRGRDDRQPDRGASPESTPVRSSTPKTTSATR